MERTFRMVDVKDHIPTKTDNYWTNIGLVAFFIEDGKFEHENIDKLKWWLEEIVPEPIDSNIKEVKRFVFEVIEQNDGITLTRENTDGFNELELIGWLSVIHDGKTINVLNNYVKK